MKKIILFLGILLTIGVNAFAAWDATKPADNEYDYLVPGDVRSNFSAVATGTDPALCLTTAKVCSGTQFTNAMIAPLSSSNMVSGAALYSLSSTPSGAGALPLVNGGTGQTTRQAAMDALGAASLSGTTGEGLVSNGTDLILGYPASLTISSMTQGDILFVNSTPAVSRLAAGTSGYFLETQGASANPTWAAVLPSQTGNSGDFLTTNGTTPSWGILSIHGSQTFTSSGSFTVPTGGEMLFITAIGGGGGGGQGDNSLGGDNYGGGGGGAGGTAINYAVYVPAGSYTVTIGSGGTGGSGTCGGSPGWSGCSGGSGTATSFGSLITANGGGGGAGGTGINQGGGGSGGGGGSVSISSTSGFSCSGSSCSGSYVGTAIGGITISGQSGGGRGGDNSYVGGAGGATPYGNGGAGANGANTAGSNGAGYGSGGGGSAPASSGGYGGGNGNPGEAIVSW